MGHNKAIDHIMKRTFDLFNDFGITDELRKELLFNIATDWQIFHREVR